MKEGDPIDKVLYESELRVMNCLWETEGRPIEARSVASRTAQLYGWNKNTTYTVLNKLIAKGYVLREEPGFCCKALLSREQARSAEIHNLVQRFFQGSVQKLVLCCLKDTRLSRQQLRELRRVLDSGASGDRPPEDARPEGPM